MITFYEGRPGNYKSYAAVKLCLKYLGNGGVVGGNLPFVESEVRTYLRDMYAWDLQPGQLIALDNSQVRLPWMHIPPGTKEHPSLCVVDEAGRYFNARDWAQTGRDFLDFLALHRHEYTDILFIDQHAENVDKQFRRLVSLYHVFRNLREASSGLIPVNLVVVKVYDTDRKTPVNWSVMWPSSRLYRVYNSYNMTVREFPRLAGLAHFGKQGKIKGKLSMNMKLALVVGLVFAGWCVYSVVQKYRHVGLSGLVVTSASRSSGVSAVVPEKGGATRGNPVGGFPPPGESASVAGGSPSLEHVTVKAEYVAGSIVKGRRVVVIGSRGQLYEEGKFCGDGVADLVTPLGVKVKKMGGGDRWIFPK